MSVLCKLNNQLNGDPDTDCAEAHASDLVHDDLQVCYVVGACNQGCSPVGVKGKVGRAQLNSTAVDFPSNKHPGQQMPVSHQGLVGRAIVENLPLEKILRDRAVRLDLAATMVQLLFRRNEKVSNLQSPGWEDSTVSL